MSAVDRLLGQFADDWKAGRRPDVDALLARAPARDRAELAELVVAWLEVAPTPRYDEATRTQLAHDPLLEAARAARSPMPERLPLLRRRAGLELGDLAERLAAVFGLSDVPRAARYLARVESGELDSARLSRRLIDGLAAILRVDPVALGTRRPALAAGQPLFRADEDAERAVAADLDVLSRAAFAPAPAPMDELDRLFLGGPGG